MIATLTVKLTIWWKEWEKKRKKERREKAKKSIENIFSSFFFLFQIYLLDFVYCITHMFKNYILEKSGVFRKEKISLFLLPSRKRRKEKKTSTKRMKGSMGTLIFFFVSFSLSLSVSATNRARMFSPFDTKCTKMFVFFYLSTCNKFSSTFTQLFERWYKPGFEYV